MDWTSFVLYLPNFPIPIPWFYQALQFSYLALWWCFEGICINWTISQIFENNQIPETFINMKDIFLANLTPRPQIIYICGNLVVQGKEGGWAERGREGGSLPEISNFWSKLGLSIHSGECLRFWEQRHPPASPPTSIHPPPFHTLTPTTLCFDFILSKIWKLRKMLKQIPKWGSLVFTPTKLIWIEKLNFWNSSQNPESKIMVSIR